MQIHWPPPPPYREWLSRTTSRIDAGQFISTPLQQLPQPPYVRLLLEIEHRLDQARGWLAAQDWRDQIARLVGHFVAAHRILRRAAHGRDALRERRAVVEL